VFVQREENEEEEQEEDEEEGRARGIKCVDMTENVNECLASQANVLPLFSLFSNLCIYIYILCFLPLLLVFIVINASFSCQVKVMVVFVLLRHRPTSRKRDNSIQL